MAFVSERRIAIGNALERAKFEIINAQEAKAQAMDDKTLLWHIYKAQKALKQAAALLVEDGKQTEDSSVRHCEQGEANNDVEPLNVVDGVTAMLWDSREQTRLFNKWLELTETLVKRCDNPKPLIHNLVSLVEFNDKEKPIGDIVQEWLQVTDKIVAASEDAQKMRKVLIKYLQHKIVEEDMLQDIINSTNNIERSEQ